jgi:predicted metal-dependent enzyme (double-stranded beta helix superfamily)
LSQPPTLRFDLTQLIEDCQIALRSDKPERAMREVVARAVAEPGALMHALGEPKRGEIQRLFVSPELTILNVVWAAHMSVMPHNHEVPATIGIYTGREDNIFWRRLRSGERTQIEAAGAQSLGPGDVVSLGRDIIHSVINPLPRLTAALHVYAGDFFTVPRSEWDVESLQEHPYDVQKTLRMFEEANARVPSP